MPRASPRMQKRRILPAPPIPREDQPLSGETVHQIAPPPADQSINQPSVQSMNPVQPEPVNHTINGPSSTSTESFIGTISQSSLAPLVDTPVQSINQTLIEKDPVEPIPLSRAEDGDSLSALDSYLKHPGSLRRKSRKDSKSGSSTVQGSCTVMSLPPRPSALLLVDSTTLFQNEENTSHDTVTTFASEGLSSNRRWIDFFRSSSECSIDRLIYCLFGWWTVQYWLVFLIVYLFH